MNWLRLLDVDAQEYGLAMLKAGADLSDKTLEDLIEMDAKEFTFGDVKIEIAQVNAIDINDVMNRQAELEELLNGVIAEKELGLFLFVVTDILNNDSVVLALGKEAERAGAAFNVSWLTIQQRCKASFHVRSKLYLY